MINYITSNQNKIYKRSISLLTKKYRDKENQYIIEGENLIEEAEKNKVKIEYVIIKASKEEKFTKWVKEPLAYVMEDTLYTKLSQTEQSQGILAIVSKKSYNKAEFLNKILNSQNILIMDRLQDPGNIGTIIRTADAAGYGGVVAIKGTSDIYSPKVIRAATGSVFRIPILYVQDNEEVLELVKAKGLTLITTALNNASYYYQEDLRQNIALVIGNEGNGVSQELLSKADKRVKIPMSGNIESLNASIAAAILMYEGLKQKHL